MARYKESSLSFRSWRSKTLDMWFIEVMEGKKHVSTHFAYDETYDDMVEELKVIHGNLRHNKLEVCPLLQK